MFRVDVLDGPLAGTEIETESESILYADYKGVKYAYNLADKFPGSPFLTDFKSGLLTQPVKTWKKLGTFDGMSTAKHLAGEKVLHNPYLGRACWITTPFVPLSKLAAAKHIVAKKEKSSKPKTAKGKVKITPLDEIGKPKNTVSYTATNGLTFTVGNTTPNIQGVTFPTVLKDQVIHYTWASNTKPIAKTVDEKVEHQTQKATQFAKVYGAGNSYEENPYADSPYVTSHYQPYTGWGNTPNGSKSEEFPEMFDYVVHSVTKSHVDPTKDHYHVTWEQNGASNAVQFGFDTSMYKAGVDVKHMLAEQVYSKQQQSKHQFLKDFGWVIVPVYSNNNSDVWKIEWLNGGTQGYHHDSGIQGYVYAFPQQLSYPAVKQYLMAVMDKQIKASAINPYKSYQPKYNYVTPPKYNSLKDIYLNYKGLDDEFTSWV